MEQIKLEAETKCYINFNVNEEGTLDYDKELWKIVEPKLRAGWSHANVFDIISKVYFSEKGWISKFTIEVDKKKPSQTLPIKIGDVKVEISGDKIIAEFGGVVSKNFNEIIADIREGYLPGIMEDFENLEKTQLSINLCYAQLKVKKIKDVLATATKKLKEAQDKLENYIDIGGSYYGKEKKNYKS